MAKKKAFFVEPSWLDVTYQFLCHVSHIGVPHMVPHRFGTSIGMKPYNYIPGYHLGTILRVISVQRRLFLEQAVRVDAWNACMRVASSSSIRTLVAGAGRLPALAGRGLVAAYRYTLAPLIGLNCRHLPTCSDYADQALGRFGLWAGGWMTLARLCRCHPWGTSGLDFVPGAAPSRSRWFLPWRYGRWRGTRAEP
jgi:uncharacterized protein